MFKKAIETLFGGAIGLTCLYVVARVAYEAGRDSVRMMPVLEAPAPDNVENIKNDETEEDKEEQPALVLAPADPRPEKVGFFARIKTAYQARKTIKNNSESVLNRLISAPESHKVEAFVEDGEVHINISDRRACSS